MYKKNIVILGPTATGKTRLAALVASLVSGEVISADSRQVYRGMDQGTGKDLMDYIVDGRVIPSHLIDIADAGSQYNIYDFQRDFINASNDIISRNKTIVVCGGSGMYLETALGMYQFNSAPEDIGFRAKAETMTDTELLETLSALKVLHNTSDSTDRQRIIRAIEVARAGNEKQPGENYLISPVNPDNSLIFGIDFPRSVIRDRITQRLEHRFSNGMLNEIEFLLNKGIPQEDLLYYGLEYKFITLHLTGKLSYNEMFSLLNTAIHQFAKRQMTWFRRMEKKGIKIQWLDGENGPEANAARIADCFYNQKKTSEKKQY